MRFDLNFWGTLFYLILIVFGIIIAGLGIQLASQLIPPHTPSTGVMQYVAESVESSPLQDLTITNGTCPIGFELLTIGMWSGSRLGCYIQKDAIGESCIEPDIPAKDPRSIFRWRNLTFCVKRNIDYEFRSNITCRKDFIKCSKELCVSAKEKCPITSINVREKVFNGTNSVLNPNWIDFTKGNVLELLRESDREPIFNIEVSILGKPCFARGWVPFKENPYQLLQIKFGCGEYGQDNETQVLDIMDETELYLENGFEDIFNDLTGYKERIHGDQAYLVSRQRPELRQLPVCYESHVEGTELHNLNSLETWGEWIFTLVLLELIMVVPLIMFLYRDIKRKGLLKRLGPATKMALLNIVYYGEIVFFLGIYLVLKGVRESSKAYLVLADIDCFMELNLMNAAVEFSELVKRNFYPNYTKVSLILWFGVARILASILMAFYLEGEKKSGYNPYDSRNKSETEIQWFFQKKDKEQEKQYLSI